MRGIGIHGTGPSIIVYATDDYDDLSSYKSIYDKINIVKITYYDNKKGKDCTNEYNVPFVRIGDTAGMYHNYIHIELSVKNIGGSSSGYAMPKKITLTFVC